MSIITVCKASVFVLGRHKKALCNCMFQVLNKENVQAGAAEAHISPCILHIIIRLLNERNVETSTEST